MQFKHRQIAPSIHADVVNPDIEFARSPCFLQTRLGAWDAPEGQPRRALINAFGVRLLSLLNNVGVATEILGMLVFAVVLLFLANNQPVTVLFQTFGAEKANNYEAKRQNTCNNLQCFLKHKEDDRYTLVHFRIFSQCS